jgi:hypothetical protein
MVAYGFGQILLLFAMTGVPVNDIASVLEPGHYLKAHEVELKAEKLVELATHEAKVGKDQLIQLMAIRWLGLHPDDARKAGAIDALHAVADGKKGQGPHDFAKEHAARALARIEGKRLAPARTVPPGSIRDEALAWFPAEATIFGAFDLRPAEDATATDPEALAKVLARVVPEPEWKPIYDFVDTVGNLRLDRIGFALEMEEQKLEPKRIWVRFSGAGDLSRLEECLATKAPAREVRKRPGDAAIVIRTQENRPPGFGFIGSTDVIIVGFFEPLGKPLEVVDALLQARAGKRKSVVSGPFADDLKKVNAKSQGVFVAALSDSIQANLMRGSPFKTFPTRVVAEATGGKVLALRLRAIMKDEEAATAASKTVAQLREQGLRALKDLPPEVKIPKEAIDIARKALTDMKVTSDGSEVTAVVRLPADAGSVLLDVLEALLTVRRGGP